MGGSALHGIASTLPVGEQTAEIGGQFIQGRGLLGGHLNQGAKGLGLDKAFGQIAQQRITGILAVEPDRLPGKQILNFPPVPVGVEVQPLPELGDIQMTRLVQRMDIELDTPPK